MGFGTRSSRIAYTSGGTFDNPAPSNIGHPPVKYGYDSRLTEVGGDAPVPVRKGDSVNIYVVDSDNDPTVSDRPRDEPEAEAATAIALESGAEQTLPLPQEEEANPAIYDENPRQLVTSVDTRESVVAGYLDRWKRKIETMGVKYFPEEAVLRGHVGAPTLEVTIDASGELRHLLAEGLGELVHAAERLRRREQHARHPTGGVEPEGREVRGEPQRVRPGGLAGGQRLPRVQRLGELERAREQRPVGRGEAFADGLERRGAVLRMQLDNGHHAGILGRCEILMSCSR